MIKIPFSVILMKQELYCDRYVVLKEDLILINEISWTLHPM